MQFGAVLAWVGNVGQHVMFALVHEVSEPWPADAKLVGDMAPSLDGVLAVRLIKHPPNGGGPHGMLAFETCASALRNE